MKEIEERSVSHSSFLCCNLIRNYYKILKAILRKVQYSFGDEFVCKIAEKTEGHTGADLQALVYNAQLEAVHNVIDRFQNAKKQGFDLPFTYSKRSSLISFQIQKRNTIRFF